MDEAINAAAQEHIHGGLDHYGNAESFADGAKWMRERVLRVPALPRSARTSQPSNMRALCTVEYHYPMPWTATYDETQERCDSVIRDAKGNEILPNIDWPTRPRNSHTAIGDLLKALLRGEATLLRP